MKRSLNMVLQCFVITILCNQLIYAQPEPEMIFDNGSPAVIGGETIQNALPKFKNNAMFTESSVWHKNMELICPLDVWNKSEGIEFLPISYGTNNSNTLYGIVTLNFGEIRVSDVTNPRSATPAVIIKLSSSVSAPRYHNLQVWTDNRPSSPLYKHTLCVVAVEQLPVTVSTPVIKAMYLIYDLTEAINLTSNSVKEVIHDNPANRNSVHLLGSTSNTHKVYIGYIQDDPTYLFTVGARGHTLSVEKGQGIFIVSPLKYRSFSVGKQTGIDRGFVDLYKLGTLGYNTNINSTSTLVQPTRLVEEYRNWNTDDITVDIVKTPIRVRVGSTDNTTKMFSTTPNQSYAPAGIHETHGHRVRVLDANGNPTTTLVENKIMLYCASYTDGIPPNNAPKSSGGVIVQEISFTSSNSNQGPEEVITTYDNTNNNSSQSAISFRQHWQYDNDRFSAEKRITDKESEWFPRTTHTVEGLHFDTLNHLFITTDEMISGEYYRNLGNSNSTCSTTAYNSWQRTIPTSTLSSGAYSTFTDEFYNYVGNGSMQLNGSIAPLRDMRRIGFGLRAWQCTHDHIELRGVGESSSQQIGNDAGPVGMYDVPEMTVNDFASGTVDARVRIEPSQIDIIRSNTTNLDTRGNNSIHHVRSVYSALNTVPNILASKSEAYIAYYTQGARIIDFKEFFHEDGHPDGFHTAPIIEKAYFDPYPTINNKPWSRYFWGNNIKYPTHYYYETTTSATTTSTPVSQNEQNLYNINYFNGAFDTFPDLYDEDANENPTRTGLYKDENFVYSAMWNGQQTPWPRSRIFILRYFRDKIGGTITGFPGGSGGNTDMPFGYVNLQGQFTVERDVTIASTATVTLLPGTPSKPGTYNLDASHNPIYTTSITDVPDNHVIYVDGTLIIGDSTTYNSNGVNITYSQSDINLNANIIVRDGGKVIFNRIEGTNGPAIIVNQEITAQQGATIQFNKGAYVILNKNITATNANIIFDGSDQSPQTQNRILIQGLSNSSNTITGYSSIIANSTQTGINPQYGYARIHNTDFKNVEISTQGVRFFRTGTNGWNTGILCSSFNSDSKFGTDIYKPMVSIFHTTPGYASKLRVQGSVFSYSSTNNGIAKVGLKIFNSSNLILEPISGSKNQFLNLFFGVDARNVTKVEASINEFDNCMAATSFENSAIHACSNIATNSEYDIIGQSLLTGTYYDNEFDVSSRAATFTYGGEQFFRNNVFTDFCSDGISSYGANLRLRPVGFLAQSWLMYGRNYFDVPQNYTGQFPFCRGAIHDITIRPNYTPNPVPSAELSVECGYNSFAQYSNYHVSGTNAFNPEYNLWNPNPFGFVRCDVLPAPVAFNQAAESSISSCSQIITTNSCGGLIPPGPPGHGCSGCPEASYQNSGTWLEQLPSDAWSYLPTVITMFKDTSLMMPIRVQSAYNAVAIVALSDSLGLYQNLISELNTVINPLSHSMLSASALMLKGYLYETQGLLDSALLQYQTIISYGGEDSVIASWQIKYLSAQIDTLGFRDSLYGVYAFQLIDDLRFRNGVSSAMVTRRNNFAETTTTQNNDAIKPINGDDVLLNGTNNNSNTTPQVNANTNSRLLRSHRNIRSNAVIQETVSTDNSDTLLQNTPNPFFDKTSITYSIGQSDNIRLTLWDMLGNEIKLLDSGYRISGTFTVELKTTNLPSGIYTYRLEVGNKVLSKTLSIVK